MAPSLAAQFVAENCAVGGQTVNAFTHDLYSTVSQLLISYLFWYYNAVPRATRFFPSNNLAFPTKRFRTIGGFEVICPRAAGDDRELCDRRLHHGYRMIHAPEAMVYHVHDLTFRKFLSQHFHNGPGAFCLHRVRAGLGQHRIKVKPQSTSDVVVRGEASFERGWLLPGAHEEDNGMTNRSISLSPWSSSNRRNVDGLGAALPIVVFWAGQMF